MCRIRLFVQSRSGFVPRPSYLKIKMGFFSQVKTMAKIPINDVLNMSAWNLFNVSDIAYKFKEYDFHVNPSKIPTMALTNPEFELNRIEQEGIPALTAIVQVIGDQQKYYLGVNSTEKKTAYKKYHLDSKGNVGHDQLLDLLTTYMENINQL